MPPTRLPNRSVAGPMPAPKGQQAKSGTRIAALHIQRGITQAALAAAAFRTRHTDRWSEAAPSPTLGLPCR
jgi:hypothetical protein